MADLRVRTPRPRPPRAAGRPASPLASQGHSPNLSLERFVNKTASLKGLRTRLESDFLKYENLYYKEHWQEAETDEADYSVVLPIHTQVVNIAHAIITGFPPNVRVYPNRPTSERDIARADDVELWHLGVDHVNELEADTAVKDLAVFNQCLYGVGVLREVYNFPPDWLTGGEADEDSLYPIVQQALDPKQVWWERGNPPRGQFRTTFYEHLMTVHDIEVTYQVDLHPRLDDKGEVMEKDWDEVRPVLDWWEWIGGAIHHTIFTTTPDRRDPEPFGMFLKPPTPMPEYYVLPYHIFPFYATGSSDYEKWGLSILYPLTDIPHLMEIIASRQMRAFELYADPVILAARGINGGDTPIPVDKSPGSIVDMVQGDDVRYLQWQGSPPDVRYLWEKFEEIQQELAFSRTLLSQGNSADASGFRTALERETSLLKIAKGMQNYERMLGRLYAARAYAISKLSPDRPVPARGIDPEEGRYAIALTGERVGQYRDIVVEITPQFPGDMAREINTANQAIASHLWSLDDGMERIHVRNKRKQRESILKDQVEFHPLTIQSMAEELIMERRRQAAEEESLSGTMTGQLEGGQPGPLPNVPGLPGTPAAPGQPAGALPASPEAAGLDNRLASLIAPAGPRPGTATPSSFSESLGTRRPA